MNKNAQDSTLPRYSVRELQAISGSLFSVKPEVVYGALSQALNETYEVEEARRQIQQFMKAKVN